MDLKNVVVIDHPMVQHKLTLLRDKDTSSKQFRELIKELSLFEGYEATRDFSLQEKVIETPMCTTTAYEIEGKKVAVVPILRAGLGMVEGILELSSACALCLVMRE